MKQDIIIKRTGQRVNTHKETAKLLIEMGRAVSVEEHLAAKAKADAEADERMKKVIHPEQVKGDVPKIDNPSSPPSKRKYERRAAR